MGCSSGRAIQEEENPYSQKKHIPQYEPTGDFVDIMELIDDEKTNELIKEIKSSNVSEDQKNFLIKGAYRHLKFNFIMIFIHLCMTTKLFMP